MLWPVISGIGMLKSCQYCFPHTLSTLITSDGPFVIGLPLDCLICQAAMTFAPKGNSFLVTIGYQNSQGSAQSFSNMIDAVLLCYWYTISDMVSSQMLLNAFEFPSLIIVEKPSLNLSIDLPQSTCTALTLLIPEVPSKFLVRSPLAMCFSNNFA